MCIFHQQQSEFESSRILPYYETENDNRDSMERVENGSTAKTRLEVLSSFEINLTVFSMYTSSLLSLVYVYLSSSWIRSEWNKFDKLPPENVVEELSSIFIRIFSFLLAIVYNTALVLHGSATLEQKWTAALLSASIFCLNPLSVHSINWKEKLIYNGILYSSCTFFYILASIHSYRILNSESIDFLSAYRQYGYVILFHALIKLVCGLVGKVSTSSVPFLSLLSWCLLPLEARQPDNVTAVALLITIMDIYLIVTIAREASLTRKFLARQTYLENRSKQLGFRCFEYQLMIFSVSTISISLFSIIEIPHEIVLINGNRFSLTKQLDISTSKLGLFFIYFSWTSVNALINLPPGPLFSIRNPIILNFLYYLSSSSLGRWLRAHTSFLYSKSRTDATSKIVQNFDSCKKKKVPFKYSSLERYEDTEIGLSSFVVPDNSANKEMDDKNIGHTLINTFSGTRSSKIPVNCYITRDVDYFPEYVLDTRSCYRSSVVRESAKQVEEIKIPFDNQYKPSNENFALTVPIYPGFTAGIECWENKKETSRSEQSSLLQNRNAGKSNRYGSVKHEKYQVGKRLRVQNNVFVIETQILLAQVAYLSYIPGNANEEFLEPSEEEKQIAHQLDDDGKVSSEDDGSRFLVDVAEISSKHGYFVYKQVSNEETNTHATILCGRGRVLVGFSGTRDTINWGTNSKMQRVVYEDLFSKFEFEIPNDKARIRNGKRNYELYEITTSLDLDNREKITGEFGYGRNSEQFSTEKVCASISECCSLKEQSLHNHVAINECGKIHNRFARSSSEPHFNTSSGKMNSIASEPLAVTVAHEILTYGKAKVHSGFAEAYKSIRKYLLGALVELYRRDGTTDFGSKNLPVLFCGHSLGGALAMLATFDAANYHREIGISSTSDISCSTYGCPRVGNDIFKRRYENLVKNHWRFEIASDPVPYLPSCLNYTHVGTQVLLDQSGTLLVDPSIIEMHFWGKLNNFYTRYKLHTRASYISALRSYCRINGNRYENLEDRFWAFPIKAQTKGIFEVLDD